MKNNKLEIQTLNIITNKNITNNKKAKLDTKLFDDIKSELPLAPKNAELPYPVLLPKGLCDIDGKLFILYYIE